MVFPLQIQIQERSSNPSYQYHCGYRTTKKGENMKKLILALFAVLTLSACMGHYKSGNCEYDFLLHKDISISKIVGNVTGGC